MIRAVRRTFERFFAERGTHLAAMVAYFAMASFVPLIFLALSLLGLTGRVDESSALVDYLESVFPGRSVQDIVSIVNAVRDNARTLSIVGGVALLWSSLSLFSALESAFNILYGRPNRSFLRGKGLAASFMVAALIVLFVGLAVGTLGYDLLKRYVPSVFDTGWIGLALTILFSSLSLFVFLFAAYYRLPNARMTWMEVLPGAIIGAIVLEVTLQGLPLFVWIASGVVALQALGATFLLLVWLYLMANVIVFCAAFNWQLRYGTGAHVVEPRGAATTASDDGAVP